MFLPEKPNEICDRLKLLLQKNGTKSDIFNEEIVATADKFLE